jgi:hypothetical protein
MQNASMNRTEQNRTENKAITSISRNSDGSMALSADVSGGCEAGDFGGGDVNSICLLWAL